ncbi:MAG TPA: phosphotransferase [Solirubrobacteraceae bacterium]|jgi:trehalose synthase-fused probable maltokinase|nr:phosphotransferase [Solirubrobacteraceae bacterium]
MPDPAQTPGELRREPAQALSEATGYSAEQLAALLDCPHLRDWITKQRWYASKTRPVTGIDIVEEIPLRRQPTLVLALAQARFAQGTHELYQLPLGVARRDEESSIPATPIGETDELVAYDAVLDPVHARELLRRVEEGGDLPTSEGMLSFRCLDNGITVSDDMPVRPVGVEQSNSSLVFGDRYVLKVFRKIEPGINPELELLRFLTARGFPNIAALHGWYEYEGAALAGTLGVAQQFVPDATDGWTLALDEAVSVPDRFLEQLGDLGLATAQMHTALASDAGDPAFSPEEPSQEAISLLTATIDEDIERMFLRLPEDDRLAPIIGRGEDVRERLAARAQVGLSGKQIRIHGDYHLGQTLFSPRGWVILDFEGEPARALPERRQKRSPLRDVASMLRSFAYVSSAAERLRGQPVPEDFERRARLTFLESYFSEVDPTLLPAGETAVQNLLAIFELEKAIYELRYELDNRPDWVGIPVAGIERLLETT